MVFEAGDAGEEQAWGQETRKQGQRDNKGTLCIVNPYEAFTLRREE